MSFSCPLCHLPLKQVKNSYLCPQRHQFDVAKEGYVNLLPVQHKRSRDPGDSAEMMQARRAFLDAGHYQPLRDAVVAQLCGRLDVPAPSILDIGCGEGTTPMPLLTLSLRLPFMDWTSRRWPLKPPQNAIRRSRFVWHPAIACRLPTPA